MSLTSPQKAKQPLADNLRTPAELVMQPAKPTGQHQDQSRSLAITGLAAAALAGCTEGGVAEFASLPSEARTTLKNSLSSGANTADLSSVKIEDRRKAAAASRFLSQASMGAGTAEIRDVVNNGEAAWLEKQFNMPRGPRMFDWLRNNKRLIPAVDGGNVGVENAVWCSFITGPDTLRQRVGFALSEIFAVNWWEPSQRFKNFASLAFLDILMDEAFGNYLSLLKRVSRNPRMARWLTFLDNRKADPKGGGLPDENYAREIMQLFTLGLYRLAPNGTQILRDGEPIPTYDNDDVMGLARVFTGWVYDGKLSSPSETEELVRKPLVQQPDLHEFGEKKFKSCVIPAGTDGYRSLDIALEYLFSRPTLPPFISKQLIQRLVTSNPSPAYVRRVSGVFEDNGRGVRGDMKAVIRAILLDPEARETPTNNTSGKLREPILRFTQWARVFKAQPIYAGWERIGHTSDPATRLGQSPLRTPSVFNFFRPGYVPPKTALAAQGLVAPEFQIADEVAVAGYINFMQLNIAGLQGLKPDYSELLPLAASAETLVHWLSMVLAADQLSDVTKTKISKALQSVNATSTTGKLTRVKTAILMVMASPEYIALK